MGAEYLLLLVSPVAGGGVRKEKDWQVGEVWFELPNWLRVYMYCPLAAACDGYSDFLAGFTHTSHTR